MSTVPKQKAIIAYGPHRAGQWKLRDVVSRSLGEKEVLVEIVASGICHSDLHFADSESGHEVHYPRVMGHEGYISSFCNSRMFNPKVKFLQEWDTSGNLAQIATLPK
jgi:hypothetical protein